MHGKKLKTDIIQINNYSTKKPNPFSYTVKKSRQILARELKNVLSKQ